MHRSHRLVLLVTFALAASQACKKDSAPPAGLSVTLNEAGTQPREELRFTPPKGLKESMAMTMKMGMSISGISATDLPAMVMTMDLEVTDVEPSGNIHAKFALSEAHVVDEPNVMPAVREAMQVSLDQVIGLSGSQTIDNRGFGKDATMKLPPDVAPETKQLMEGMMNSMEQLVAPMPEEPVGLGAKWTTVMPLTVNGMTLVQEANYTITAIDGKLVTTDLIMTQRAEPQTIKQPNMPPVKLLYLDSSGTGQVSFDTRKLVPTSKITMESKSKLEAGGQSVDMTMTMEMRIERL